MYKSSKTNLGYTANGNMNYKPSTYVQQPQNLIIVVEGITICDEHKDANGYYANTGVVKGHSYLNENVKIVAKISNTAFLENEEKRVKKEKEQTDKSMENYTHGHIVNKNFKKKFLDDKKNPKKKKVVVLQQALKTKSEKSEDGVMTQFYEGNYFVNITDNCNFVFGLMSASAFYKKSEQSYVLQEIQRWNFLNDENNYYFKGFDLNNPESMKTLKTIFDERQSKEIYFDKYNAKNPLGFVFVAYGKNPDLAPDIENQFETAEYKNKLGFTLLERSPFFSKQKEMLPNPYKNMEETEMYIPLLFEDMMEMAQEFQEYCKGEEEKGKYVTPIVGFNVFVSELYSTTKMTAHRLGKKVSSKTNKEYEPTLYQMATKEATLSENEPETQRGVTMGGVMYFSTNVDKKEEIYDADGNVSIKTIIGKNVGELGKIFPPQKLRNIWGYALIDGEPAYTVDSNTVSDNNLVLSKNAPYQLTLRGNMFMVSSESTASNEKPAPSNEELLDNSQPQPQQEETSVSEYEQIDDDIPF